MLQVRGLKKRYGEIVALEGVDLSASAGEIVALLGRNGAGKSTLISCIAGLVIPDAGVIELHGSDGNAVGVDRRIGLAPQDTGIYPRATVDNNLRFFGRLAGLGNETLTAEVWRAAEALQLTELLSRRASKLSGGEKRRLHAAIAIMGRPPLLLLDEPTVGADVATRSHVLETVCRMAEEGASVLYSTHYLPEVEELGARVVIIDKGRVVVEGSVSELVSRSEESVVQLEFVDKHISSLVTALELIPGVRGVRQDAEMIRVHTTIPTETVAFVSQSSEATGLRSIEVLRPSLETVFMNTTGRRFESDA